MAAPMTAPKEQTALREALEQWEREEFSPVKDILLVNQRRKELRKAYLAAPPSVLAKRLEGLRELSDKATAGKWLRSVHCFQIVAISPLEEEASSSVTELNCPRGLDKYPTTERIEQHKMDVEFIVACVNEIRRQLAALLDRGAAETGGERT